MATKLRENIQNKKMVAQLQQQNAAKDVRYACLNSMVGRPRGQDQPAAEANGFQAELRGCQPHS